LEEINLAHKISVCVICTGEVSDLRNSLSDLGDVAGEIIIVNPDPDNPDPSFSQGCEKPVAFIAGDTDLHQLLTSAIKKAQGEWILMLKSDEVITADHTKKLRALCNIKEACAYYLNTEKKSSENELSAYEWMGSLGKYSTPTVQSDGYIPCLEIRLFRKNQFLSFQKVGNDAFEPVLDLDMASIPISNIRATHLQTDVSIDKILTEDEQSEEDLKRFQGIYEEDIDKYENFSFLESNAIGYSLVKKKDLPSLEYGLEIGFGNIDLLKFMVHFLIKDEAYEDAIEFADRISEKLGEHIELWRLKGTAYFYMLNFIDAESCFLKALSFNKNDYSLLSNLAKISIILNKFDQSKRFLNKIIDIGSATPEIEFIYNLVNENQGKTATLSAMILCRDEEDYIGRVLDSVNGIVDEIVIVDTGSKDNTIEIALEYGATVVRFEWEDNFGKARNYGLKHITSDYVLCLDADEFLEIDAKMSLLVFKHILPLGKKIGIILDIHTLAEENWKNHHLPPQSIERRTAIFPNLSGVCYNDRIFERIDDSLDRFSINRIVANNTHISHQSNNRDLRKTRKINALEQSIQEPISISMVLKGIDYWIDRGNIKQGFIWFDRVIKEIGGDKQYERIICYLIKYFEQYKLIDIHSRFFDKLLSIHSQSYKIMTVCADLLYENKDYKRAIDILEKLTIGKDQYHYDIISKKDFQLNLLNFAMANLNSGNFNQCDQALNTLSMDEEMADTIHSVIFYYKLKQNEIDQAISVLDTWIRERNLPIKSTLNSFVDLLKIIVDVADIMFQYGQIGAGKVLAHASEHLAASIGVKE
jgi:glycosyltransferase involved in cell wall biosynthesis